MRIVLLGAGGHARVILESLRLEGAHEVAAFLDPSPDLIGREVDGVAVLPEDAATWLRLASDGVAGFLVTVGDVRSPVRRRLFEQALSSGLVAARSVHPAASVAPSASLGEGTAVFAGAILGRGVAVGANAIVNTGAIVDHDGVIGDHAHVAPGAVICGGVAIGAGALIGAGSRIREGLAIGDGAVVGMGAVVVADVPPGATVVGIPARRHGIA